MVLRESQRRCKPGEIVPASGLYRVTHARHRAAHEVILLKGQKFPNCRRCGDAVRFQALHFAEDPNLLYGNASPTSLLIVEQEAGVSFTLKKILELEGYEVSTASSLNGALDMLKARDFDAVLTELDLEADAEGLQLAKRLQRLSFPPIVIVSTAKPTVERLRSMLSARVNYLLFKPIDLDELKSVLTRTLARRAVQQEMTLSL